MRGVFKNLIQVVSTILVVAVISSASDWDRSVSLYNKGDYPGALAEFQDVVRDRPDAAGAWYYIGLCEFKLKRYARVELPLSRAIDLLQVQSTDSADIAGAWYTIGISQYFLSQYDKAIEPLKRYLDLTVKAKREVDPGARTALGRAYFFLDRYDEALALLSGPAGTKTGGDKAKEAAAGSSYYVGAIYFKREDDDRAIPALREAANATPEDVGPLDLLAESLLRKARKTNGAGAAALWNEAGQVGEKMRLLRDDLKTANALGRAYLGARQFDKAVAPLEKIATANPENGQAQLYYGIALSRSGQIRKAMEALEITIQLIPDSMPALSELAYVYESDKQYQQALRIYEKILAANNDPGIRQSIERVKVLASQQP